MSVIVKGMEMPKNCKSCPLRYSSTGYTWCDITGESLALEIDMRNDTCPLVEIPTPHGRLIDIRSVEDGKFVTVGNDYQRWWNGALESVIDNAPTVIEAEGETYA